MMWNVPNAIVLCHGTAEGTSSLNAFDNALLAARVGHLNLVKVSSVLPPAAQTMSLERSEVRAACQAGAVVPCVLASVVSSRPGKVILSCVAVGFPSDTDSHGMIYEHAGTGPSAHAINVATEMLKAALARRGTTVRDIVTESSEQRVTQMGCSVTVALLRHI